MLDLDGTLYQALDLKVNAVLCVRASGSNGSIVVIVQEKAFHATIANGRSIGIEIANVGAYPVGGPNPFSQVKLISRLRKTQFAVEPRFPAAVLTSLLWLARSLLCILCSGILASPPTATARA
jgi:hypothetical protein